MALAYGISSKGKPIVLYRNFEYVTDKENVRGTIAWRCRYHQTMKCKARLTTGWSVAGIQVTTTLAMSALLVHERRSGK